MLECPQQVKLLPRKSRRKLVPESSSSSPSVSLTKRKSGTRGVALAEHAASVDIKSRKQAGDAVSFEIVGASLLLSSPHG